MVSHHDNYLRSEEVLGKALRRVPRHTYYIGTKVFTVHHCHDHRHHHRPVCDYDLHICDRWGDTEHLGRPLLTSQKKESFQSLISHFVGFNCRELNKILTRQYIIHSYVESFLSAKVPKAILAKTISTLTINHQRPYGSKVDI